MPRKDFLKDLTEVQQMTFPHITAIETGTETGELSFVYLSELLPAEGVVIQTLVPEVSSYPTSHDYFLFTQNDENIPTIVSRTLEALAPSLAARTLSRMLQDVAIALSECLTLGESGNPTTINENEDGEEASHNGDAISVAWSEEGAHTTHERVKTTASKMTNVASRSNFSVEKVKFDLQAARAAGFRVGILGDLASSGVVCISIRVRRLGISEEAMQAWSLKRKQYLVLMIKYEGGYRTLEQVKDDSALVGRTEMRVALCTRYKPTLAEALNTFAPNSYTEQLPSAKKSNTIFPLFIGRPMNDLLTSRFARIVKFRLACGYGWTGAENFLNDTQGKAITSEDAANEKYYKSENVEHDRALPEIVTADSIAEARSVQELSLPLVTMQFVLRHLVRCTEFCLVCHCKIEASFEALKPYVCSKSLCLYQYMALGFGPSIEWEIVTQPYVVDVLVSFCYASACSGRLKDFPTGIALKVPMLPHFCGIVDQPINRRPQASLTQPLDKTEPTGSFKAKLDKELSEIVFDDTVKPPVKAGDWIVVQSKILDEHIHYRVQNVSLFPTIRLDGKGIFASKSKGSIQYSVKDTSSKTLTPAPSPDLTAARTATRSLIPVECFIYDKNFDDLEPQSKQHCITMLLDTLPSILQLRNHLFQHGLRQDMSLRGLRGEVSESALNLLRWIIASNRSCIMQVDNIADQHKFEASLDDFSATQTQEDRVSGMDSWIQFRFAQGAPDKEQRFINCVNEVSARSGNRQYPTLFSWHGSPIGNWHSIVREGLHFNDNLHGRAYGNGVYMSPQCTTSLGYSRLYHQHPSRGVGATSWPNSELQISRALSLNEVVNAPSEYVSRSPHYVVDKLDWIQTRYLFVQGDGKFHSPTSKPSVIYEQDPSASAYDEKQQKILIPISAVSKSRRPVIKPSVQQVGDKKAKTLGSIDQQTAEDAEDDADSILTDADDREYLDELNEDVLYDEYDIDEIDSMMSVDLDQPSSREGLSKRVGEALERSIPHISSASTTSFVPGTLDFKNLKMLKAPDTASVRTTKTLMRALKETLDAQERIALQDLGWYIDAGAVTNMYQWIIELHSFDPELPLAKDMTAADLKSIVIEMRFTNSFPFSPPFVRVIKPRFVPFSAGGGGHVTAGGAICMQLLTNDGWLPSNTIESVLMQVRLELSTTDPPARLERSGGTRSTYGIGEAIEAYRRACMAHGWTIPLDFDSIQKE